VQVGDLVRYCTRQSLGDEPAEYVLGIIIGEGAAATTGTIWRVFWSFPERPKAYGVFEGEIEVINENR